MLKNKIYRYLSKEIFKSFITFLFAFAAIAWTVRAVNFLDLIVDDGHSIRTYLYYSILVLSTVITKFIPISFLIALIMSIIRFQKQNELIILWSSGVSKIQIVNLFFKISLIITLFQMTLSVLVTPYALNKSRSIIKNAEMTSIFSITKANDFSDTLKHLTFYVEKKTQGKLMENIFIKDTTGVLGNMMVNKENSGDTTIIAKKGYVDKNLNNRLFLFDGIIQSKNKDNEIKNITFKKTQILLDGYVNRSIKQPKIQETNSLQLIKCYLFKIKYNTINYSRSDLYDAGRIQCPYMYSLNFNYEHKRYKEIAFDKIFEKNFLTTRENISKRFGIPLFIPLIALISSFLLISGKIKSYNFFRKYFYFIISFLLLITVEIVVKYTGLSILNLLTFFLIPFLIFPIIYVVLLNKFRTEKFNL